MLSPESDMHYFYAKASHVAKGGGKHDPIPAQRAESWNICCPTLVLPHLLTEHHESNYVKRKQRDKKR